MPGRIEAQGKERLYAPSEANGLDARMSLPDGTSTNGGHVVTNGLAGSLSNGTTHGAPADSPNAVPPEIDHVVGNYMPLSRLFQRTAQECFNNLNDTITALAALPATQPAIRNALTNGAVNTAAVPNSEKKLKWLHFANNNREKFIKLLVLLQWSRRIGEVSKLIDLVVWANNQIQYYDAASHFMGEIKRGLHQAKVPSPDIQTAIEVLTLGRSERMPELGYIPPEPLSPEKLLATLKTLNIILHLRLNIHEDLPQYFKTYSIASGRVTFTVASEFEVDLSLADEDAASQFYFIDFRFLFSPVSKIPAGPLRSELEGRANEVLASDGLTGCFRFLHDFVLTHKLNIMKRQALELNQSMWSGTLRVEQMHRVLIVQYWVDRPGSKNWLEIGIVSGKEAGVSRLAVKWFRAGEEVKHANLCLHLDALSIEATLTNAIAQHSIHLLSRFHAAITAYALTHSTPFSPSLASSDSEPSKNVLRLANMPLMHWDSNAIGQWMFSVHETTGEYVIKPINHFTQQAARALKHSATPNHIDIEIIKHWLALELQDRLERNAKSFGFEVVSSFHDLPSNFIKESFPNGTGIQQISFFSKPQWTSGWTVCAVICDCIDMWWISRLIRNGDAWKVADAFQMPLTIFNRYADPERGVRDRRFWDCLEFSTIKAITYKVNQEVLDMISIPYTIPRERERRALLMTEAPKDRYPSTIEIPLVPFLGLKRLGRFWKSHNVTVKHCGHLEKNGQVETRITQLAVVQVSLRVSLRRLLRHMLNWISIREPRTINITLLGELGSHEVLLELRDKLHVISRLNDYGPTLLLHPSLVRSIDWTGIRVDYGQTIDGTRLEFILRYQGDGRARLELHPLGNPHQPLLQIFQGAMDTTLTGHDHQMLRLVEELTDTLPVVCAIRDLASADGRPAVFDTEILHQGHYRLYYDRPRCIVTIEAASATRGPNARWRVSLRPLSPQSQGVIQAIKTKTDTLDAFGSSVAFKSNVADIGDGFLSDVTWAVRLARTVHTELQNISKSMPVVDDHNDDAQADGQVALPVAAQGPEIVVLD